MEKDYAGQKRVETDKTCDCWRNANNGGGRIVGRGVWRRGAVVFGKRWRGNYPAASGNVGAHAPLSAAIGVFTLGEQVFGDYFIVDYRRTVVAKQRAVGGGILYRRRNCGAHAKCVVHDAANGDGIMAAGVPWPDNLADYIGGHLTNFSVGTDSDGPITWALHVDTLIMSWAMALLALWLLKRFTGTPSIKSPSKGQVFCEMLFGFFDKQVRDLFPAAPPIVGPLAVTIFIWVFLMNCMDLLPVDLIAAGGYLLTDSVPHFKVLPTADLSLTAAMALAIFGMTIYYNIKTKGGFGFMREIAVVPFGIMLAPVNILLRIVEEIARPLSLSMRLFGNLFAAEMIFLLIGGGMSYVFASLLGDGLAFAGQWIFGGPWAIYHILVVPLQAYIFAVLTVVYLAMAHEKH